MLQSTTTKNQLKNRRKQQQQQDERHDYSIFDYIRNDDDGDDNNYDIHYDEIFREENSNIFNDIIPSKKISQNTKKKTKIRSERANKSNSDDISGYDEVKHHPLNQLPVNEKQKEIITSSNKEVRRSIRNESTIASTRIENESSSSSFAHQSTIESSINHDLSQSNVIVNYFESILSIKNISTITATATHSVNDNTSDDDNPSTWSKYFYSLLTYHSYFSMFFQISVQNTRFVRWINVVIKILLYMLMNKLFDSIFYPDTGKC